eukprot:g2047.t2
MRNAQTTSILISIVLVVVFSFMPLMDLAAHIGGLIMGVGVTMTLFGNRRRPSTTRCACGRCLHISIRSTEVWCSLTSWETLALERPGARSSAPEYGLAFDRKARLAGVDSGASPTLGVASAVGRRLCQVYLGPPLPACRDYLSAEAQRIHPAVSWWAPPVAEHAVPSLSGMASHAAFLQLRLLFVNRENYWWGKEAEVLPSSCWLDLMQASVNSAMDSPAARPERYGLRPAPLNPHGLWLEFGVGSGKTTAAIAMQMRALVGQELKLGPEFFGILSVQSATLHGFDSFQGLPSDWDYTHLGAGTFSTGGQVPPHLLEMPNVRIHMGLFSETLGDLDEFGTTPVAFAHIDVDIFPSAIEVLSRIACQLMAGSVLVYDELVNYVGFELSGEYRAWEYVASTYGIGWQYAGMYWQQERCLVASREIPYDFFKRLICVSSVAAICRVVEMKVFSRVEHLVMKSMCADLIRGQIDEVNQLVTVTWVKPRILDPVRIDLMRERMDAWASQTGLLLEHLEQVTPELLVS